MAMCIDDCDTEIDDAREDERREYEYRQREISQGSFIPFPKDGKIAKYLAFTDYGYDGDECNRVIVDRTTGRIALKYDMGDPANTNASHGAEPDNYYVKDLQEMINPHLQKFSDEEIKKGFNLQPAYDEDDRWDWEDDHWEPEPDEDDGEWADDSRF